MEPKSLTNSGTANIAVQYFVYSLSLYVFIISLLKYNLFKTNTHTMKCTSVTHFHIINHAHNVWSTQFHGKEEHRQCATSCCRSTRHTVNVKGQRESSSNMPPVYSNLPFLRKTFSMSLFWQKQIDTERKQSLSSHFTRSLTSSPLLNKSGRCCKVNIFRVKGTVYTHLWSQ